MSKKKCPICGTEMKIDTSAVCTSIPPKYRCVCPSCNCLDFIKTSEYDQYKEEPSLPSNLDEAAWKFAMLNPDYQMNRLEGFKAGVEWMAGQGVKATASVGYYNQCGLSILTEPSIKKLGFKEGDELELTLRKKQ